MRTKISIATVAILACLCVGQAADEPAKHPGLRFIHVGNSHSNTLRYSHGLAKAAGHPQHQDDEIYVLGSPLR